MGFGWLTIGYFFVATVSMTALSLQSPLAIGILAGYPMMVFGLYLLAHYHRYFRVAFYTSLPTLLLAVYYAFQALAQFGLSVPLITSAASTVISATSLTYSGVIIVPAESLGYPRSSFILLLSS